jgi:hypothetical protein
MIIKNKNKKRVENEWRKEGDKKKAKKVIKYKGKGKECNGFMSKLKEKEKIADRKNKRDWEK